MKTSRRVRLMNCKQSLTSSAFLRRLNRYAIVKSRNSGSLVLATRSTTSV